MLLPRFSIRWTLGLTTAMAVFFVAVRAARQGTDWAIAIVAVICLALVIFSLYGIGFLFAVFTNALLRQVSPKQVNQNPFVVEGQFPPQDIPKNPGRDVI